MADRNYRLLFFQQGSLDHISDFLITREEAFEQLAVSRALHVLTGWDVTSCACGNGFNAVKGDVRRSEHFEHVDAYAEDAETFALAVGILAPASLDGRLSEVIVGPEVLV